MLGKLYMWITGVGHCPMLVPQTANLSHMTHSSPAIANEFVKFNGGAMAQMRMHKLAYIAHGWNLALYKESLAEDLPEAWDNGPVFRRLWDRIRDFGTDTQGLVLGHDGKPSIATTSARDQGVLDHVWRRYKRYSAFELSEMTHEPGTPWTQIYFSRGRNAIIPNKIVMEHYRELAFAGRQQQSGQQ